MRRILVAALATGGLLSAMAGTPAHATDVITDNPHSIGSGNVITIPVTVFVPIKDVAIALLGDANEY